ncbi:ParB/RepB/Spo0J family partition protein [Candidatus Saccharibacteria bacterium]|nr:ParB/RepB/Spo0J family partition protein [Candidatus Saccharibacteria bacterium]
MGLGKGLGRGFESLIPTDLIDDEFDPTAEEDLAASKLLEIPLNKIVRDEDQPRKEFDAEALEALAQSIRVNGVLQPIVVVREGEGYKIVAGERRYRAAGMAGLEKIPAIVRTLDAQNRLELSIIENAQREDLNAIELATAYAKLKAQFNLSPKEIGERIGKSESAVVNTLRLLNLPEFAKQAMREHGLSEGVMRPLITMEEGVVREALTKIIEEGWSARRVEEFIKDKKKKPRSSEALLKESAYQKQEVQLTQKWAAKRVKITGKSITVTFKNGKELEDYLAKISA